MACEPLPPQLIKDPRISVAPDCSFTEGQYGFIGPFQGGRAVDLGDGKVGQKLINVFDSGLCGVRNEQLFLVDCATGRDLVFEGRPKGEWYTDANGKRVLDTNPDLGTEIASIQKPRGPLVVSPSPSMERLVQVAKAAGIDYAAGSIRARVAATKRKNRFDPFCGCKLHYPNSPGAKS